MNPAPEKSFDPTIWVDEHSNFLYAYAYSRVRNEAVAKDLVQETLLSAINAFDNYQAKSSERSWLTGILKHKVVDHFRKSSREVELTEEEADMSSYDYMFQTTGAGKGHWTAESKPTVWQENPEQVLEHAEFRGILTHCLGELPERVANCFTLREIDGYESDKICNFLNVSPNNFWVMMHRARLHLRRCIDNNWFKQVR